MKNKKMLIYGSIAVVIVVVIIVIIRMNNTKSKEKTTNYIPENGPLATYDELIELGYNDEEAKQLMNSETYKMGIKNY